MKTNEKFNKFIEDAAKSADQVNFIDMVKRTPDVQFHLVTKATTVPEMKNLEVFQV